jgi:hypothetical protein
MLTKMERRKLFDVHAVMARSEGIPENTAASI